MSRRNMKYLAAMGALFIAASLAGCGNDSKEAGTVTASEVTKVDDATCSASACHDTQRSRVTGVSILDTYRQSGHFIGGRVGCQDCHGGGSEHFGRGPLPFPDPAKDGAQGQCWTCHGSGSHTLVGTPHFNNITGAESKVYDAMYMSKNGSDCKTCHNPHNPDPGQEHKDWAEAGNHGDVAAPAFADEDFKGNASCVRCHTTTGFLSFVRSYKVATTGWGTAGDFTREVITCKACHTNYDFKNSVRATGGVVAPYKQQFNTSASVTYPDAGASNLCIACHSGRESGGSVAALTSFTNTSAKTPHYMTSAEVFYGKAGFHFYTSNVKYNTGYNIGADTGSWSHGTLGVVAPNGTTVISGGIDTGSNGPCVACHLGNGGPNSNGFNNAKSHSLDAFVTANWTKGLAPTATNTGCYGCHSGEDMKEVAEEEKVLFDTDMDFFKFTLKQNGVYYNSSRPNFRDASSKEIKDWTAVGPTGGSGKNTMGAAFNYYLLSHDPGMHVHNRTYARYLIFDSIQYLQQAAVTYSNQGSTINYKVGGVSKSISIAKAGGVADPNSLISFTSYSTAVADGSWTRPAGLASVTDLKGHLVRKVTSSGVTSYYRR